MSDCLNPDVHHCDVDGRLIFLDICRDRYFRLTEPLEAAVRVVLSGGTASPDCAAALRDAGILRPMLGAFASGLAPSAAPPPPCASAMERAAAATATGAGPGAVLEIAWLVAAVKVQLRHRPLHAILARAAAQRRIRPAAAADDPAAMAAETLDRVQLFARTRRLIPCEPSCLLDSLALMRFLSRRGLPSTLVFGVTAMPFAAHCWLQCGDVVLNDTLTNALAHTPILVV